MSVYKEPRITNAFAGIHSTRNRIFCLPADRTECGSIIVRSDPVIAAPAILFLAESETVMNRSAARGVDFPFAVSWRSHSGACPFGRTGEFPRQYAIRLSKARCQALFFVALHLIATGKAKVHPLTLYSTLFSRLSVPKTHCFQIRYNWGSLRLQRAKRKAPNRDWLSAKR